jgi:thiamine biosynthesis protein ThiS
MELSINGKKEDIKHDNLVVSSFLENRNMEISEADLLIINGITIQPTNFDSTQLNEGDVIEIVSFVGGG